MKKYAIIVAAGSGTRMDTAIPKQFLPLGNSTILMQTINKFYTYDIDIEILVVLNESQFANWKQLCRQYKFEIPHKIIGGGATRFNSVQNALSLVENESLVAIHDGVRPFVSKATLDRCFNSAVLHSCIIPVIPIKDSIRKLNNGNSKAVERNAYIAVQTPQVFWGNVIKKSYAQPYCDKFTDDASVAEALGYPITLVDGNIENIKITTQFDLKIAEILIINPALTNK